jgi:Arginase family
MAERDEEPTFVGTTNLDKLAEIPDNRRREAIERAIELGLEAAGSVQDRTIPTFSRGYQPAFAGISTFLKAPYLEDVTQVGAHDVAIVGAPFDMGTTFRPGARWAPQAVRQISKLYDGYNLDMAVDLFAAWRWSRCHLRTIRATSPRCLRAVRSSTCWPCLSRRGSSGAGRGEVGGHSGAVTMARSCSALSGDQPAGRRIAAQPSTNSRV